MRPSIAAALLSAVVSSIAAFLVVAIMVNDRVGPIETKVDDAVGEVGLIGARLEATAARIYETIAAEPPVVVSSVRRELDGVRLELDAIQTEIRLLKLTR
jgi:hypothetical protein